MVEGNRDCCYYAKGRKKLRPLQKGDDIPLFNIKPSMYIPEMFFFFWQIQAISFFLKHSLIVLHLWKLEHLNKIPRAVFPLSFTSRTRNKEEEKNPNRILSESHFFEFLFLLLEHQQFKVFRGTQMCSTTVLVVACS